MYVKISEEVAVGVGVMQKPQKETIAERTNRLVETRLAFSKTLFFKDK